MVGCGAKCPSDVHFIFLGNGGRIWSRFQITAAFVAPRWCNRPWNAVFGGRILNWDSLRRDAVTQSHFKYGLRSVYTKLWDTACVCITEDLNEPDAQSFFIINKTQDTGDMLYCTEVFIKTWKNLSFSTVYCACRSYFKLFNLNQWVYQTGLFFLYTLSACCASVSVMCAVVAKPLGILS